MRISDWSSDVCSSDLVIIRQCDPAYTVELTATYLAYSRIPLSHLWEAQSCLEIAAVEDFTRRADAATLPSLQKALDRLDRASAGHYLAAACEFHQIIADHSGHRALALFVGVALRYEIGRASCRERGCPAV